MNQPHREVRASIDARKAAESDARREVIRRRTLNVGVIVFVSGAFAIALAVAFLFASIWQPPAGLAGGFEFFATGSLLFAVGGVAVGVGSVLVRRGVR